MRFQDCRVLLADGVPSSVALLRRALWDMGFTAVDAATDGCHALFTLKKTAVDLLVLDWALPGMDGEAVLTQIRRIPRFVPPRVLVVQAAAERGDIERCAAVGVADYLVKPFNAVVFRDRIERLMEAGR